MKKLIILLTAALCAMQGTLAFAQTIPTADDIAEKSLEFAALYPYKDGDVEKSFAYDIPYTSGFETRSDGREYECPAVYRDKDAAFTGNFDLNKGDMGLHLNGKASIYAQSCVCYNGTTLVPVEVFDELGCSRSYNEGLYLTTLAKNDTVLELMPYLIGMRKNRAEGYYVPLTACARFVDERLYVPVRAVAEELGLTVGWDGESKAVTVVD